MTIEQKARVLEQYILEMVEPELSEGETHLYIEDATLGWAATSRSLCGTTATRVPCPQCQQLLPMVNEAIKIWQALCRLERSVSPQ